ncbi:monovalent cation/H(+) antiporter subunit G [Colwellia maritima]|nr:monovalent cation/H(+) antiporter subunit G [Colwellia maritima]
MATLKLFAIMVFLLLTGPTSTYALANAALLSGLKPDVGSASDEPKEHK